MSPRTLRRLVVIGVVLVGALDAGLVSAQNPPETVEYYATDALGSVRVVFTPTGQVVGRSAYLPFGDTLDQSGALPRQRFTGQERDGEAGLDYFNARSLQMRTGRMNQPDPLLGNALTNPQRWNRYAYVDNNPLAMTDPSGLSPAGKDGQFFAYDNQTWATDLPGLSPGYSPLDATNHVMGATTWTDLVHNSLSAEVTSSYAVSVNGELPSRSLAMVVSSAPTINPRPVSGTITCVGDATYRAVGGNQATADGALFSKYPELAGGSIKGGTFGTVAVQTGFLGLGTELLRMFGTQIFVTPDNQALISKYGGPTGPLSVSDYGDKNIQGTPGVAFDIYRFPTETAGNQFGRNVMGTTITFPAASGGTCPPSFRMVPR
jgi:RHS repeat-associated protein